MQGDQQIQSDQYELPYHWFFKPDTFRGREYWGYLKEALEQSEATRGQKILDAGCGDGAFLNYLYSLGYTRLTGYDFDEKAISFAKALCPNVALYQQDLLKLDEKEVYDVIFLIETLEHINPEDIQKIISNLYRALKKGGRLVVTVPSVNKPLQDKHYQHFTKESLKNYLGNWFLTFITGQDYKSKWYKLLDNRFYNIKPLSKWYNLKIYPKYNKLNYKKAERLISVSIK